jgi:5'-3' exoribonuclease 2
MADEAAAAALLASGAADDIFDEPLRDDELDEGLEAAAAQASASLAAAPLPPAVASASLDEMQEAVEEDVAASLTTMMKSAVLRALLAKRTRENVPDIVAFGTQGAKDRYYRAKFGDANGSNPTFLKGLFKSYAEGLCWVFRYYYQGVASWTWFFPFHYAPMASDLRNLDNYEVCKL